MDVKLFELHSTPLPTSPLQSRPPPAERPRSVPSLRESYPSLTLSPTREREPESCDRMETPKARGRGIVAGSNGVECGVKMEMKMEDGR